MAWSQWLALCCTLPLLLATGAAGSTQAPRRGAGISSAPPGYRIYVKGGSDPNCWIVGGGEKKAATVAKMGGDITAQVQNGRVAGQGQFPYIAALFNESYSLGDYSYCSGSLIAADVILTAAHCLVEYSLGFIDGQVVDQNCFIEQDYIKVGLTNTKSTTTGPAAGVKRNWKALAVPDGYSGRGRSFDRFDIGLIFLDAPVTTVQPVKLAQSNPPPTIPGWRSLAVAGFGNKNNNAGNNDLRVGAITFVPNPMCNNLSAYTMPNAPIPVPRALMCAGYSIVSTDACAGDSGGPLLVWSPDPAQHLLVGLVHAGADCASMDYPIGFYSRVNHFRGWIDSTIAAVRAKLKKK